METIQPIIGEAAAVAETGTQRLLLIADIHAGYEIAARYEEGLEIPTRAHLRRERLLRLVTETSPDRLIILGDLTHSIGKPGRIESEEIAELLEPIQCPITVVKGNHDGILEELLKEDPERFENMTVTKASGEVYESLGVLHGHTWPDETVLQSDVLCIGHEHPTVRLQDEVGGFQTKRVWLRGPLSLDAFPFDLPADTHPPELILFPAFNELSGGTWVNDPEQGFLSPFLPAALPEGIVYLLDGTELGEYRNIPVHQDRGSGLNNLSS